MMFVVVFFFKQKTAYEMRISDWSSDVCSSDLNQCASRSTDAALWWSFPWRSMSGFVRRRSAQTKPQQVSGATRMHGLSERDICSKFITQIGRASCRERVCQYV